MVDAIWDLPATVPGNSSIDFQLGPNDVLGTPSDWSVTKRTLNSGISAGVELIEVDNGRMKIWVIASRGMGVWAAESEGQRLGWNSPVRGPVNPRYVSLMEPTGTGWLDGFDELMVRCGLESNGSAVFDAQSRLIYPLHGRIANRPAHSLQVEVDAAAGTITLRGIVDECRFHYQKLRLLTALTTSFGSTAFRWSDKVENLGGAPAGMQMLYHINIGEPLLTPGSRLIAPVREVSPHDYYPDDRALRNYQLYPAVTSLPSQQSFFFDLLADESGATQVLLEQPSEDRGLAIRFNRRELPCFTQWRNNVSAADGYVTGLEPGTNFPNPRPFEERNGRVITLVSGGVWQASVELELLLDHHRICKANAEIEQLRSNTIPEVHDSPQKDWSAKAN
jgi:hypothetical protein